jgi:hypothetical protein
MFDDPLRVLAAIVFVVAIFVVMAVIARRDHRDIQARRLTHRRRNT